MRTCEKNKITVYYTNGKTLQREVDENGFYTGNTISTYEPVSPIKINLYPSTGKITKEIFGDNLNFDMLCVEIGSIFNKDTLIFLNEPTVDYDQCYDYSVSEIKQSLNISYYGLKRRV